MMFLPLRMRWKLWIVPPALDWLAIDRFDGRGEVVVWQYPSMTLGQWTWAPLAAAVAGALITGFVASRNARKHPYELLKNLVEIADKLPEGSDPEGVISGAITSELDAIAKSKDWDTRHPILSLWVRFGIWPILLYGAVAFSFALGYLTGPRKDMQGIFPLDWVVLGWFGSFVVLLGLQLLLVSVVRPSNDGLNTSRSKAVLTVDDASSSRT